ncbi:MAG: bacterial transcriptional activator domain-containing protein, partial [Caldilineales bacterium]|nr:bacterial transcriptional activator domain-containing protein [Caldilineales bacterium]
SVRGRGTLLARLALLTARQGEMHAALAQAREAAALLAPTGHRHPLVETVEAVAVALAVTEPDTAAALLAAAAAERDRLRIPRLPPWRDRIQETIDQVAAVATAAASPGSIEEAVRLVIGERPSLAAEVSAQPSKQELRACALGPTLVTVDGKPVPASAWTYRKAYELFFYLLDRPKATKAEIGLDLWPDASPAQLRNYLHRSLHFIRQAIGDRERVRFANGAYEINRELPLWYDVAALEDGLQRAAALGHADALTPSQRAAAIALLAEAAELWRGGFLANLDVGEWAILRREELRMAYLQGLLDLGRLCLLDRQYDQAAATYRRALAEDPYLELAQRELMRCLARQGERSQALRQYRELAGLLAADLKAAPSPETTQLYERIRRGDDV